VNPSREASGSTRNIAPDTNADSSGGASIGAGSSPESPASTRATTRSFSSSSRLHVE
jgi:hypothetical protein